MKAKLALILAVALALIFVSCGNGTTDNDYSKFRVENLTATSITSNSITISWSMDPKAESYSVNRSPSWPDVHWGVKQSSSPSYTDTGLKPETNYYYIIGIVSNSSIYYYSTIEVTTLPSNITTPGTSPGTTPGATPAANPGTTPSANPGNPDTSQFSGTYTGYYDSNIQIIALIDGADWKFMYYDRDGITILRGSYTINGDSAALRSNTGQTGTATAQGNTITVNYFSKPFTLTKRTTSGTTSGTSTNKSLGSIPLIYQPNNYTCSPACVKMIEEFYFGASYSFDYIYTKIKSNGSIGSSPQEEAFYLEARGLYVSHIKFSNLAGILNYLQVNQIPAIMSIGGSSTALLHSIVFAGYDSSSGYITVRDPWPVSSNNIAKIHYYDLLDLFKRSSNDLTIVSNRPANLREFECTNCRKRNFIDRSITQYVEYLWCTFCGRGVSVR